MTSLLLLYITESELYHCRLDGPIVTCELDACVTQATSVPLALKLAEIKNQQAYLRFSGKQLYQAAAQINSGNKYFKRPTI